MTQHDRVVVKLGGSLLDWPTWPAAFATWWETESYRQPILVTGGGRRVEQIRARNRQQRLDPTLAHWECIAAMSETAHQVAEQLFRHGLPTELLDAAAPELSRRNGGTRSIVVLNVARWLRQRVDRRVFSSDARDSFEPQLGLLPIGWEITSDSIAAF
ncbi:MAG: hypothetical protein KDA60_08255, partial [Planctomycetales bacterium]|nr:hypothetical protein [Planctomycetales bacterium]